jgi:hypothetical protein
MGECLVSHLIPVGSIITHTWIQKSIYLFIYLFTFPLKRFCHEAKIRIIIPFKG